MTAAFVVPGLVLLVALSALVVRRMIAHGVLDVPGHRSSHDRPTPKGGGWGILAAFLAGLAGEALTGLLGGHAMGLLALAVAAAVLGAVSWADDVVQFGGFKLKLAAQCIAAMIVVLGGLTIDRVGPVPLGAWGVPVTMAWLLLVINAVNFIDGLNGLASGCGLIASVTLGAAGLLGHAPVAVLAMLPLAAGIVGFLPFNFPKARIFMGDVGSQVLGLLLGAMAAPLADAAMAPPLVDAAKAASGGLVSWSGGGWGVLLAPMLLAPILVDVLFTLMRRAVAGDRLAVAHRGHLYQLVHRAGWPATRSTFAYWGLTALAAGLGLVAMSGDGRTAVWCVIVEAAAILMWMAAALAIARRAEIGRW